MYWVKLDLMKLLKLRWIRNRNLHCNEHVLWFKIKTPIISIYIYAINNCCKSHNGSADDTSETLVLLSSWDGLAVRIVGHT